MVDNEIRQSYYKFEVEKQINRSNEIKKKMQSKN